MIWWERDFWSTWLAWWLDGCPPPRTWWGLRQMQQSMDRFAALIGKAMLPSIERATAALTALVRAYQASK